MGYTQDVLSNVLEKNPGELEFHQAVSSLIQN